MVQRKNGPLCQTVVVSFVGGHVNCESLRTCMGFVTSFSCFQLAYYWQAKENNNTNIAPSQTTTPSTIYQSQFSWGIPLNAEKLFIFDPKKAPSRWNGYPCKSDAVSGVDTSHIATGKLKWLAGLSVGGKVGKSYGIGVKMVFCVWSDELKLFVFSDSEVQW